MTHSMGGLLARALLAQAPREFGALVHTWVAVGCPFGGAPGWGVDALVTGVQFAGSLGQFFFVDRGTSRQVWTGAAGTCPPRLPQGGRESWRAGR